MANRKANTYKVSEKVEKPLAEVNLKYCENIFRLVRNCM